MSEAVIVAPACRSATSMTPPEALPFRKAGKAPVQVPRWQEHGAEDARGTDQDRRGAETAVGSVEARERPLIYFDSVARVNVRLTSAAATQKAWLGGQVGLAQPARR